MKDQHERLPPLSKRIIYLDQMVLSNIAKRLDPIWRATRANQDDFWIRLFHQVERLVKLQLAIFPSSPIHEKESIVTRYAAVLARLHSYLSTGVEFEFPTYVHARQLHNALDAADAGTPTRYLGRGGRDILRGRVDTWTDRIQISVNFPTEPGAIDRIRASRDTTGNTFHQLWERWKSEPGRSFDERYRTERTGLYFTWVELYNQYVAAYARAATGGPIDIEEIANPRLEVSVIQRLVARMEKDGASRSDAHRRLKLFLESEEALAAPANDISAMLMAALARRATCGQKRVPSRGTWNDITSIATYLPYCDAMFMDDEFAVLLDEEPLRTKLREYKERIFSNRTREAFLTYLHEIEKHASSDHISKVIEAYGESWLEPYKTVLEDFRGRTDSRL